MYKFYFCPDELVQLQPIIGPNMILYSKYIIGYRRRYLIGFPGKNSAIDTEAKLSNIWTVGRELGGELELGPPLQSTSNFTDTPQNSLY